MCWFYNFKEESCHLLEVNKLLFVERRIRYRKNTETDLNVAKNKEVKITSIVLLYISIIQ